MIDNLSKDIKNKGIDDETTINSTTTIYETKDIIKGKDCKKSKDEIINDGNTVKPVNSLSTEVNKNCEKEVNKNCEKKDAQSKNKNVEVTKIDFKLNSQKMKEMLTKKHFLNEKYRIQNVNYQRQLIIDKKEAELSSSSKYNLDCSSKCKCNSKCNLDCKCGCNEKINCDQNTTTTTTNCKEYPCFLNKSKNE